MENELNQSWAVWIDDAKKIISTKELPNTKQTYFADREKGIKIISELVSKGYKIG